MSTRPTAFEARLKAELVAIAADRAELDGRADFAVRSSARRFRIPLAVGLAAAAVGLLALPVMGDQGGGSAAYALTKGEDGTITVKLFNAEGVPGLERELRGLGVPVAVIQRKPAAECDAPGGGFDGPVWNEERQAWEPYEDVLDAKADEPVLKINSRTVKPGHTLVLVRPVTPSGDVASGGMGFGTMETSRLPSCIPDFSYSLPEGAPTRPAGE
ncbi:hypothetical protein M8Z33_19800 [Streptomyces sp. ZAF1911]|uniref:hypothetical protein n=1 Tax=Streptomyces sp. ZAF1911 TaxID=2944129 RepID=UPI00237B581B|nr:hypothetical protein [Streptomyces sp. ZAF1911]MDD9378863.1 hypothetical protein [Streptomyces sp. ZAF1911]